MTAEAFQAEFERQAERFERSHKARYTADTWGRHARSIQSRGPAGVKQRDSETPIAAY